MMQNTLRLLWMLGLALPLASCGGRTAPGAWWVTNANTNVNVNTNANTNTHVAVCGNGICETGEAPWNCPMDCAEDPWCGDGICDFDETSQSCPEDCAWCGDGVCDSTETAIGCPEDCTGTRSCQAVLLCNFCCTPGDLACEQSCRSRGTDAARVQWDQFQTCTTSGCYLECVDGLSPECIMCGMQVCNDYCGYGEVGTASCGDTLSCLANCSSIEEGGTAEVCNDDPGIQCHDACFHAASHDAIESYDVWVRCLVDACGDRCSPVADARTCIDCALQNCAPEMNDCYGATN